MRREQCTAHMGWGDGMAFIADDLTAWLIGWLADAGRKRLVSLTMGTAQERALERIASSAIRQTVRDFKPEGGQAAEQLAMTVSQVFGNAVPLESARDYPTLLEGLYAGIDKQIEVLNDASLTGVGES